jgi:hypothetical protein
MTTEIAPGGAPIDDARSENRACDGATSSVARECAAVARVPVQTLRDLLARVEREWCSEHETSTPGGHPLVGDALAREQGWRAGWNASQRSMCAALARIVDVHTPPPPPISEIEARELLAAERREQELEQEHERRARTRIAHFAFEFDVDQYAITEVYDMTRSGEGG